jgi:hypothetical protein
VEGRQPVQIALTVVICAALVYAVVKVATDWSDWVVFGVIVLTAIGAAIAVNQRQYPTRKRAYTRQSENRDRRPDRE